MRYRSRDAVKSAAGISPVEIPDDFKKKDDARLTIESVSSALRESGGNKVKTARMLGVGHATLYIFLNENPVLKPMSLGR